MPYLSSTRLPLIIIFPASPFLLFAQGNRSEISTGTDISAPLCPRVGSVIDSTKRVYFDLFPDVDDFVSARVEAAHDSFIVTIFTGKSTERRLRRTVRDAAFLRWYLDKFETIAHRE